MSSILLDLYRSFCSIERVSVASLARCLILSHAVTRPCTVVPSSRILGFKGFSRSRSSNATKADDVLSKRIHTSQARDAYFTCLGAHGTRRALRILKREYEKACPASWVKHFDKKRDEENKLKQLLETRTDGAPAAS